MLPRIALFGALLVAVPSLATAQERRCRQVLPSDARRLFNAQGEELIYFRDPVRVLCTGGLRLEADSAVMNRTTSSVQLVDNVVYQDSLRELTAEWANYLGHRDQLLARGSVVLRDLRDGARVQGDELDYLRASADRPNAQMIVRGRRPYAIIPPPADSGEVADSAESTEIWADRMEFEGEEVFRAFGDVDLRRGTMLGAADTATFLQPAERMTLEGNAHVRTPGYRLDGARIDAFLAGQELREILADRSARVESEELTVEADRIRIGFIDGELNRMEAWNPEPDSVPRALADARDFRLWADSIDARSDSLGIREVRAVGHAYGEQFPEVGAAAGAMARDWIQGDTVLGFFGRRTTPRGEREGPVAGAAAHDSVAGVEPVAPPPAGGGTVEVVLERIVVIGGGQPALSLYRRGTGGDGPRAAINFMKAGTITLFMADGGVSRVEADGAMEGLYLTPAAQRGASEREGEGGGGEGAAAGAVPAASRPAGSGPEGGSR